MKANQLTALVMRSGATLLRVKGSHHHYRFVDGQRVMIPVSGHQTEVSPAVLGKVRKVLQSQGVDLLER